MTSKKKAPRRSRARKGTRYPIRSQVEIMRGFPEPGPGPSAVEINADSADFVIDREWRLYAYRAVHDTDPEYREFLLAHIIHCLHSGAPLSIGAREWLIFVLATLQREDRIPRLAKGRPVDRVPAIHERRELREYLLQHSNESGDLALQFAAQHMGRPFHHVRKMYYSSEFVLWRREINDARRAAKIKKTSR